MTREVKTSARTVFCLSNQDAGGLGTPLPVSSRGRTLRKGRPSPDTLFVSDASYIGLRKILALDSRGALLTSDDGMSKPGSADEEEIDIQSLPLIFRAAMRHWLLR